MILENLDNTCTQIQPVCSNSKKQSEYHDLVQVLTVYYHCEQ